MLNNIVKHCAACALLAACDGELVAPAKTPTMTLKEKAAAAAVSINQGASAAPPKDENGRYICDAPSYPAQSALRRMSKRQYVASIQAIFDGQITPSAVFPDSFGRPLTGYSTEEQINRLGESGAENVMLAAEDVAEQAAQKAGQLTSCAPGRACAATLIEKYGQRALRGYLDDEARAALLRAYDGMLADGGSYTDGVAAMFALLLQMPRFLYQAEARADDGRPLNGIELANRLAFLLWDSGPDEELLAHAQDLGDPTMLAQQAQRMLSSPRATPALTRFFREWTDTLELEAGGKDAAVFPQFDAALAASMNEGFQRFVTDLVAKGASLHALLTSTTAFVDPKTAPLYGVPPTGGWQAVTLDGARYSGVFTQPAWLATQAHLADASYVFRGRTIRKRLLCDVLGSPPGDAQAQFAAAVKPPDPTGKDLSHVVQSNPTCASCHSRIDPIGLAFEGFDGLGAARSQYKGGKSIDPSGTVEARGGDLTFRDQVDLLHQLADREDVRKCFATQLFRFAMSRSEQPQDACAIQAIDDTLVASEGRLDAALLAVTKTGAFTTRRDE